MTMDEFNVTRIDLTEIDLDSLENVEASGGNWKKAGKYIYKIVNPGSKCAYQKKYVEGPNKYKGKRKAGCCSSCKYLITKLTYKVCEASKCTKL